MSIENLDNVVFILSISDGRAGNPLAYIPIAPPECRRSAVERVTKHGALLDGPLAQDGQAATEGAGKVKLCIGEYVGGLAADGIEVILCPALLQTDDVGGGRAEGELATNLDQAWGTKVRDVQKPPAVESEEVDFRRDTVWD